MGLLSQLDPLSYVAQECERRVPGVDEVSEWQVWTDRGTTPDQRRIEERLERLIRKQSPCRRPAMGPRDPFIAPDICMDQRDAEHRCYESAERSYNTGDQRQQDEGSAVLVVIPHGGGRNFYARPANLKTCFVV